MLLMKKGDAFKDTMKDDLVVFKDGDASEHTTNLVVFKHGDACKDVV